MRITRVYTRAGDQGETHLGGGQKVSKAALRIEAIGEVDELNCSIGAALAAGLEARIVPALRRIQNELFHLGADLCILEEDKQGRDGKPGPSLPQIEKRHVEALEAEIDSLQEDLKPLEEFILPGGSPGAAYLHLARAVCRRAERVVVSLSRTEALGAFAVIYLNRLSDCLFVMSRHENLARGVADAQWNKAL